MAAMVPGDGRDGKLRESSSDCVHDSVSDPLNVSSWYRDRDRRCVEVLAVRRRGRVAGAEGVEVGSGRGHVYRGSVDGRP